MKLLERYQYLGDWDAIPRKDALNVDAEFERVITETRLNRESEMGQIDPVSRPFAVLSSEYMSQKEDEEERAVRETVKQIIDEMEGK